jgi:3-hydroxyacyl-[acyl-carrier-protein] dehydratase
MAEVGAILDALPHGHPMVLIDRVIDLTPGRSITAAKAITLSEPCYADVPSGLPRDRYAYPVSLVIESFGQAAALLWAATDAEGLRPHDPQRALMFAAARDCHFWGRAFPGDVMVHEVHLTALKSATALVEGLTQVAGRTLASFGSMIAVNRPGEVLVPGARQVPLPLA